MMLPMKMQRRPSLRVSYDSFVRCSQHTAFRGVEAHQRGRPCQVSPSYRIPACDLWRLAYRRRVLTSLRFEPYHVSVKH